MSESFPTELTPRILFEDTHLLVIDKPAGLLSQGEKTGDLNLVDWLRQYLGRPYVGLVHRLDRNTSGIMVVAKRTKSAQRLTDALQAGDLQRTYLAWVEGRVTAGHEPLRWRHFLSKDERTNTVRVVPAGKGKEAVLTCKPLQSANWQGRSDNPLTLVELRLETGRSHQIRAQAAFEKHPLLGDRKYGARYTGFDRPALHSHTLSFPHPMSKEVMEFKAPLPKDFNGILVPNL